MTRPPLTRMGARVFPGVLARAPRSLVVFVLLALVAVGLPTGAVPARAAAGYTFVPSGLDGAGFQNVVAYSPFLDAEGRRPLLLGADVAGVHRSVDGGRTWRPARAGLTDPQVASLLFSATVPGKVWAATDSRLYVSTDFGLTWTARPGAVDFDANGAFRPGGREHPRATGTLLAEDPSGATAYLYAATATQGVRRSADDGATWERVALAGRHLRSIALDPADPDVLYAAAYDGGLLVSRDARTGLTFTAVPGTPAVVEEIEFVGGTLYVAAGAAGVFAYDGAWRDLGLPDGPLWQSLTGRVDAVSGETVLLVGCATPSGGHHTMRSTDGGATWQSVSAGDGVTMHSEEYGTSTRWWASDKSFLDPAGRAFVTSDIAIDPDDPGKVVIAGRGGAYVGVLHPSGADWWPSMRGLMATVNMIVVADPHLPGRVYVGNMDWTFVPSADRGITFLGNAVPVGAPSTGDVVALDESGPAGTASPVYLAASRRGQNTGVGVVYSNPDPIADPAGWTNEQLPVSDDVVALGVGQAASGNRVILASVTGRGLYRKDGDTWTRVTGTAPFASGGQGTFAWVAGSAVVYAMDGGGIWRSSAAGAPGSWVRLTGGSAGYGNVDSLAVDPVRPGVLYASDDALGGVVRISAADTTPVRTTLLALAEPGPIAVTPDGALLVHDRDGARLLATADPAGAAPVFTDVAGALYREVNAGIRSLSVGADGYVYTASNSAGVTVAAPLDPPPPDLLPPSAPSGLASPTQTATSVSLTWQAATDDVGVTAYRVLRDDDVVGTTAATAWTDTGVTPSTTLTYRVQAVDGAGNAGPPGDPLSVTTPAQQDSTAPSVPGGLRARLISPAQVSLTWQASSDDVGVTGYRVTRDGQEIATPAAPGHTDTGPTPGTRTYRVSAVDAAGNVSAAATAVATVPVPAPAGLSGRYYDTVSMTTLRATRVDPQVDFGWGTGRPVSTVAPDTFSVRWTGRVLPPADGAWTFTTRSDDGVRLWIDGRQVISNWTTHLLTENGGTVTLTADRTYAIRLEYFDQTGSATVRLLWSGPGTSQRVIPSTALLAG